MPRCGPSSASGQAAAANTAKSKTKTGIVTVGVLNINDPKRVMLRENLFFEGRFPPEE